MNILVVCHDYKRHEVLTLVKGPKDDDYIYLTPENIRNISTLTNGLVAKISYIDTDVDETIMDAIQYNSWNNVPENTFDLFYTIFCPLTQENITSEYGSKLMSDGKIINMVDTKIKVETDTSSFNGYDKVFFPLIVSPFSPIYFHFEPFEYYITIYDNATKKQEKKYIYVNTNNLPQIDKYGNIISMPLQNPNHPINQPIRTTEIRTCNL